MCCLISLLGPEIASSAEWSNWKKIVSSDIFKGHEGNDGGWSRVGMATGVLSIWRHISEYPQNSNAVWLLVHKAHKWIKEKSDRDEYESPKT